MQHAAHHSHPHPPPVDSLDDNHTVRLPEYTLFQLTANRKTHYPATPQKEGSSYGLFSSGLQTFMFQGTCFTELLFELVISSSLPDRGGLEQLRLRVWLETWVMCQAVCCCQGQIRTPWRKRCRPVQRAL